MSRNELDMKSRAPQEIGLRYILLGVDSIKVELKI